MCIGISPWSGGYGLLIKFNATIKFHAFSIYTQGMNRMNKNFDNPKLHQQNVHKNTMQVLGWVAIH